MGSNTNIIELDNDLDDDGLHTDDSFVSIPEIKSLDLEDDDDLIELVRSDTPLEARPPKIINPGIFEGAFVGMLINSVDFIDRASERKFSTSIRDFVDSCNESIDEIRDDENVNNIITDVSQELENHLNRFSFMYKWRNSNKNIATISNFISSVNGRDYLLNKKIKEFIPKEQQTWFTSVSANVRETTEKYLKHYPSYIPFLSTNYTSLKEVPKPMNDVQK